MARWLRLPLLAGEVGFVLCVVAYVVTFGRYLPKWWMIAVLGLLYLIGSALICSACGTSMFTRRRDGRVRFDYRLRSRSKCARCGHRY